jgi:hypothetical protein
MKIMTPNLFPTISITYRRCSGNPHSRNVTNQGPIFRTFFPGKILWKIPKKIFPHEMLGKIGIFHKKSFEKSFFPQIPQNFPRKITFYAENHFLRGKTGTKNWPQKKKNWISGLIKVFHDYSDV